MAFLRHLPAPQVRGAGPRSVSTNQDASSLRTSWPAWGLRCRSKAQRRIEDGTFIVTVKWRTCMSGSNLDARGALLKHVPRKCAVPPAHLLSRLYTKIGFGRMGKANDDRAGN